MALLDGEAEAITRKAIEAAKEGDLVAIKLVLDRIAPPRKDNPCPFQLPPLRTAADAPIAQAAIVEGVAAGDLTPGEAADLSKLVGEFVRAVEAADLAERIAALEAHQKGAAA